MSLPPGTPRLPLTIRETLDRDRIPVAAGRLLDDGWRLALIAAHDDPDSLRVVYTFLRPVGQRHELIVALPRDDAWLPTLAHASFAAGRFEREMRDLYGIRPEGHPLAQRLVRHGHWPRGYHPMRHDADPSPRFGPDVDSYPFIPVEGDGVYEIPVGPVHAGLIEPGHFRFSVVGETILQMKARLWFLHRGVEKLFEGRAPEDGIALAERISGDTAVGHGLAYVMAVEDALGIQVTEPARATRALLLEVERLHNHVSDLGAMANDVGYGIAHAHAQRLRERLLRHNRALTGHRLLRGGITIGGASLLNPPDLPLLRGVADEVAELVDITLANSVVADRFTGTSVLTTAQAQHIGTLGYVARASGLVIDARADHPIIDLPDFQPVIEETGDVLARFTVRAREVPASLAIIEHLAHHAHPGERVPRSAATPAHDDSASSPAAGLGVVEAWRGTLCHRVEVAADGTLARVRAVDPSFFNWPALAPALSDTIVPDFPLTNKSFNQSYAGNDL
ncbi:MAG TPA: NADH-quinone oxidoreductase subunit C [Motilibacterales bacterium]|nr:NADH-quinone oxidoreductase subunit C [Motilibacterales bacterium]